MLRDRNAGKGFLEKGVDSKMIRSTLLPARHNPVGVLLVAALLLFSPKIRAEFPDAFLAEYCFDCHDDLTQEAEIRLDDAIDRDWSDHDSLYFFERVKKVIASGEMPPKKEKHRPEEEERAGVADWLHEELLTHSEVGGTVLRRLNQVEYENTIESLFGFSYRVPAGFPPDQHHHGFDNQGEGLVLSPPLMEAYVEAATKVADCLFPPPPKAIEPELFTASPEELVISYSSGYVVDGAMRLASKSDPVMRSCTWPTKFEAKGSGNYRVKIDLSAIGAPKEEPFRLEIRAKKVSDDDGINVNSLRKLAEFSVDSESPKTFEAELEVYAGETLIFYFANAPLDSDRGDKDHLRNYLVAQFTEDPRLMAAWMAIEHNSGIRGGVGWERVKKKLADPKLDVSKAAVDSKEGEALLKKMLSNPVLYVETISYQHFEEGPALAIHGVSVEGPFGTVESDADREREKLQERFFSGLKPGKSTLHELFSGFLTRAFRRPAEPSEAAAYERLALEHVSAGHSLEEGIHLALRTALISPQFLYRETSPGKLDDWGLASRLSYFLTSKPPGEKLLESAGKGLLSEGRALKFQTQRLTKDGASKNFVTQFTSQWLHTRVLEDIMPDPRLLNYNDNDRAAMIGETEMFFTEVLQQNLPIETLIDPDFTFLNQPLASKFYGRKDVKSKKLERVVLEEDSPYGGILGQASVMMATANGVDTDPVLRGIWILENVLGDPPPPPPANVPAITPDTRGAKTIRDLLDAHRSDESCARCHVKMDPLGYVMENFDPVGRWRTHYPVYDKDGKEKPGAKIDTSGTLPDGTELMHVNDIKRYVLENLEDFGQCLSEKLMMYATGRTLTYADREAIKPIVKKNLESGGGFQDLLVALVQSEVFRTK